MTDIETSVFTDGTESNVALEKYLAFLSDNLKIAVDAKNVIEIITNAKVTAIPKLPSFIKGVMNLRGQIVPVIEARARLRQTPAEYGDGSCVIVLEEGAVIIGMMVDKVASVLNIAPSHILPPPANNKQELINGIVHLDADDYLILDCDKLMQKM